VRTCSKGITVEEAETGGRLEEVDAAHAVYYVVPYGIMQLFE